MSIKAIYKNPKDNDEWFCIFEGYDNNYLEGGFYKIKIKIPEDYPNSPPECYILDNF
jgi:ubiquitin-protein ligase